jgi:hypothetical protein
MKKNISFQQRLKLMGAQNWRLQGEKVEYVLEFKHI